MRSKNLTFLKFLVASFGSLHAHVRMGIPFVSMCVCVCAFCTQLSGKRFLLSIRILSVEIVISFLSFFTSRSTLNVCVYQSTINSVLYALTKSNEEIFTELDAGVCECVLSYSVAAATRKTNSNCISWSSKVTKKQTSKVEKKRRRNKHLGLR